MADENSASGLSSITEEEKKILDDYLNELNIRFAEKVRLRDIHSKKEENNIPSKKREANIKKNAAFIKKLKTVTEAQHAALLTEADTLDLTRYLAEIVQALTLECKLKISDIPFVLKFCSHLHLIHNDFAKLLAEAWQKNCLVPVTKTGESTSVAITSAVINKLRVDIRLLAEFIIIGVWPSERDGLALLAGQLKGLTNHPEAPIFTSVILNFLKYCGPEYGKLVPRRITALAKKGGVELPRCKIISEQFQDGCGRILKEYLNTVFKKLSSEQREFHQIEANCLKVLQQRGELPAEDKTKWDQAKLDIERLKTTVVNLADLVDEDTPQLEEIAANTEGSESSAAQNQQQTERQQLLAAAAAILQGNIQEPTDLFADENETSFYRKIPELQLAKDAGKDDDVDDVDEGDVEIAIDTEEDGAVSDTQTASKDVPKKEQKSEEKSSVSTPAPASTESNVTEDQRQIRRKKLLALVESLPNCANLEMIDKLAQEFASNGFTGRNTSLRLARALMNAPRTRGYILPFYARLIATLKAVMPDLPEKVANALTKELGYHIHKKDQVKIESKLKTVRFIGEMVKFCLYGKPEALRFLSTLTRDFTFHSVEMLAALLESCGRQLIRWPDTSLKMKLIVDAITRKRASMVLDARYQLLLDNALVNVKKQEEASGTGHFVRELGDPVQLYVVNQLARELNRSTANTVMRRLRMLDWDDPAIYEWLPNLIVSVVGTKLPFSRLPLLASIISAFGDYGYGVIGIRIVDTVLEHLRLSIEYPNVSQQQVRLAEARLLGECYNYRLCDSPVILRTLYLLITLGAGLPDIDPPDNLFRIRMACVILDTCGPYFDRGAHKRKLDTYLLYLQLYYWQKKSDPFWTSSGLPFPLSVEHQFLDTMELLRPSSRAFKNLAEVEKAVQEKELEMAKYVPKPGEQITIASDDGEIGEEEEDIEEDDDDEDDQENDEDDVGEAPDDSESESESQDDEEHESAAPEEMEDEQNMREKGTRGPKEIHTAEDDEFLAELEMAMASAQSSAPVGSSSSNISSDLPTAALRAAKAKAVQQAVKPRGGEIESSSESDVPEVVPFVLLARKGTKPHVAPIAVPKNSMLASGFLRHREQEEAEKAQLKKMILSHQYRQEREESGLEPSGGQRIGSAQPKPPQQNQLPSWGANSSRGGRL